MLESRFDQTPDGSVWGDDVFAAEFWDVYLEAFDALCVVARTRAVTAPTRGAQRIDRARISVSPVPYYVGPRQYAWNLRAVRRAVADSIGERDALLLRVPSVLAFAAEQAAAAIGHPIGLEVLGDPYDVFAPGAVRHPLRPFFRHWFAYRLRKQCHRASAVAYVTSSALQQRYPCDGFTAQFSDVLLPDDAYAASPRVFLQQPRPVRVLLVGSLEQMYKGADVLIDAVAECLRRGLDLKIVIAGDGKHRGQLQESAVRKNIADCIAFLGHLPHESVRDQLDMADLFVLPSRAEGLPRALLEAMARGLPCIGANVGGIPELLAQDDLVAPGSISQLASKIAEIAANPPQMTEMAARNLAKARQFRECKMRARRVSFYRELREQTENWLSRKLGSCAPERTKARV